MPCLTISIITATVITRMGYFYKNRCSDRSIDRSIDQSLRPAGRRPLIILHLWDFYASGTQDAEAIKSLKTILFDYLRVTLVVEIKVFVCLRCLFTLRS